MTNENMTVTGGPQSVDVVPKGKRAMSDIVDLFEIPIMLGIIAGIIFRVVPSPIRDLLLVAVNIGWLLFRDLVFSPGRQFSARRIANIVFLAVCVLSIPLALLTSSVMKQEAGVGGVFVFLAAIGIAISLVLLFVDKAGAGSSLKLISTSGEKVNLVQAFIRNILIMVPIVLVIGYIIEVIFVFAKGNRLADGWAHTKVVSA